LSVRAILDALGDGIEMDERIIIVIVEILFKNLIPRSGLNSWGFQF
jgi:hypothetical protein